MKITCYLFNIFLISIVAYSCSNRYKDNIDVRDDSLSTRLLQGIWSEEGTNFPFMLIKNDSIYFADASNMPVRFQVKKDSIFFYGHNSTIPYKIDSLSANLFAFHNLSEDIVKLQRSDDLEDTLAFRRQEVQSIKIVQDKISKDSIVIFDGKRYHGYVYINPSTMRVISTTFSESGIAVENVFFDNIVHLCVYQGKKMLFGRDIAKQIFADIFPPETLTKVVLADANFIGVDHSGYHFKAYLSHPDNPMSYVMLIDIDSSSNIINIRRGS